MAVNFTGITSGIDTKSIIDATIAAQRAPIDNLNTRKSTWQTQISNLGKLASKLGDLKTMMANMADMGKVLATKGSVADDTVAGITVDGAATAGHYDVSISSLARAEKDRSTGYNSDFSQVKAGTLTLTTPGKDPVAIAIEEGDSLQDVVDKINGSEARVDATIVRDGSKSYLQIVASDSGYAIGGTPDDAITISESYSGAAGTELGLTQVVTAQNAKLKVDGLDVEQRSNSITDALPGMTLQLKKLGDTTIDVASDSAGTKTKLQSFVTLMNDVLALVKSQTRTADGSRQTEPDPAVERIGRELRSLVGDSVSGVVGKFSSLGAIGIKTTTTGTFEIDSTTLDKALASDSRSVAKLFTQADTGISARMTTALKTYTDPIDGIIGGRQKALGVRVTDADSQISRMQERLNKLQSTMQRSFNRMEQTLAGLKQQTASLSGLTGYSG
ncbi:MAG: flagellar filament capping protein FliD [Myxococcota bacterium]